MVILNTCITACASNNNNIRLNNVYCTHANICHPKSFRFIRYSIVIYVIFIMRTYVINSLPYYAGKQQIIFDDLNYTILPDWI